MTDAPTPRFVHLHLHSEYSLLDGCIQVNKLVDRLASLGMTACALTDHDAMHGVVEFSLACKQKNINGIIGYEANVEAVTKTLASSARHLILLAENETGYRNLVKICSFANTEGRSLHGTDSHVVTLDVLSAHAEGLICLTSCLKGELATLAQDDDEKSAVAFLERLKSIFGAEDVFVEITDNGLAEQHAIRSWLVKIAGQTGLPIVGTGDVHYLEKSDKKTHLSLLAIKHKLKKEDVQILDDEDYFFDLANEDEMVARFTDIPEAAENTVKIASRCKVALQTGVFFMPGFGDDPSESADDCLRRYAQKGLLDRRQTIEHAHGTAFSDALWAEYEQRLEYELGVIETMKFAGYFLIVQDFINWAKDHKIPVGPGRGSAAGSLVTYALRITNIDPIRFNLLFERFLNPERISMPDIDTDFCQDRRQEVLDYCYKRYGEKNVCQIVTFGRMMAKNAIKNLARISGWSFLDSNEFAKLIPESPGIKLTEALEGEEKLRLRLETDERAQELWDGALAIEGTLSSLGIHAAGVIISDRALTELSPVMESEGQVLTQLEGKYAEKIGLIKFDFLGLKTLTVINKALQNIESLGHEPIDIESIDLEDSKVYSMLSTAHVTGIFQLESNGMRKLISELRPSCFSDIVAVLALFRPGPLGSGMVDDFVQRKHGKKEIEYVLPQLEDILSDTYGVIVFQEQVQKIAAVLANYSLGEADLLRRAMGKKDAKEMERQKARFVSGAKDNQIDPQRAEEIFDLMAMFAAYGFNKSHTAAYGWVTYQTAWLKTYHPTCFMAALFSCDLDNTDKVVNYLRDCKRLNVRVDPPDINQSGYEFKVLGSSHILYGLGAIKGIGQGIIEDVVAERVSGGAFVTVQEFIARVGSRKLNKKTLESLIKAGAFDRIERNRRFLMHNIDSWLRTISREQERLAGVGGGLFGDFESEGRDLASLLVGIQSQPTEQWPLLEELEHERLCLGHYLSSHPCVLVESDLRAVRSHSLSQAHLALESDGSSPRKNNDFQKKEIRVAGLLQAFVEKRNKDGERFAVLKIADVSGEQEVSIFPKQYEALSVNFQPGQYIWAQCHVRRGIEEGSVRLSVVELGSLDELIRERRRRLLLTLHHSWADRPEQLDRLLSFLQERPGECTVEIRMHLPDQAISVRAELKGVRAPASINVFPELDSRWPRQIRGEAQYV